MGGGLGGNAHEMPHLTQLFVAGVSTSTGLWGAYFWYRSARNKPPPISAWRDFEKGADGLTAFERWVIESAQLNRWAAVITAISISLAALSTVLGAIPP